MKKAIAPLAAVAILVLQSNAFAQVAADSTPGLAADSALTRVTRSGVLRVCMPGDYKPFGFIQPSGEPEGLDVDQMTSLAASLGAKPVFVKTTWSNLMSDFVAGKCEVGAGGISVTLERQRQAYFSAPYMVNGKVPITRCENVQKYQSVAAIDQPNVKVIYNPGGSNERFAKARLNHAHLIPNADNLTIFDKLIDKEADVFVTEGAEAIVQSRAHPELCAVNPSKPLQYSEDAYLLPKGDEVFKRYVDQWLHLSQASGEYQQARHKWLGD